MANVWLATMDPKLHDESLRTTSRQHQVREAVRLHLERARVPTPQFGARRELPQLSRQPPRLTGEEPPSYGWQPKGAAKKMPSDGYLYHEPGERVRTNLRILEHWRHENQLTKRRGGRGGRGDHELEYETPYVKMDRRHL